MIMRLYDMIWDTTPVSEMLCVSGDLENQVELEEKTRLINQVLELQNTLEGKTSSVLSYDYTLHGQEMSVDPDVSSDVPPDVLPDVLPDILSDVLLDVPDDIPPDVTPDVLSD